MRKTWIAMMAVWAASGAAMAADQPADGHKGWNPAAMRQRFAERQARRAEDMALLLDLRPDQKPSFDRFVQSMKPAEAGPGGWKGGDGHGPSDGDATLPARLDAMQAGLDRRDAAAKQRIAAARAFYASLTPDQQRRFDAIDRLRHGSMHGHHDGGFRRMPGAPHPVPPVSPGS